MKPIATTLLVLKTIDERSGKVVILRQVKVHSP
jgi:hypothetical protein